MTPQVSPSPTFEGHLLPLFFDLCAPTAGRAILALRSVCTLGPSRRSTRGPLGLDDEQRKWVAVREQD